MISEEIKQSENSLIKRVGNIMIDMNAFIGSGTYGKVYKGWTEYKIELAVKILAIKKEDDGGVYERVLVNELNTMCVLSESQPKPLVNLIDYELTGNNLYLAMEYCDGGNLESYISKNGLNGRLPEPKVREILNEMVSAFRILTKNGILHRDINLQNILLKGDQWKLSDLGLSKQLGQQEFTHSLVGTTFFACPQILTGVGLLTGYTNKCDIWSLGILLFRLLFGHFPWRGANEMDYTKSIMSKPLVIPSEPKISQDLLELIPKMLAIEEADRIEWDKLFEFNWKGEDQKS
eukprot:TRINITY_DN13983_c0_g1_i1.p1 TRINITY_DN13983_c0_g1~~TRINITY_DN13983_c0_g1_i1.p1  ORF type:complete len:291 (-),score=39.13 TRINITY_DN13983_c0_g1_i1:28-900(-)